MSVYDKGGKRVDCIPVTFTGIYLNNIIAEVECETPFLDVIKSITNGEQVSAKLQIRYTVNNETRSDYFFLDTKYAGEVVGEGIYYPLRFTYYSYNPNKPEGADYIIIKYFNNGNITVNTNVQREVPEPVS